jgi:hypothetical protein
MAPFSKGAGRRTGGFWAQVYFHKSLLCRWVLWLSTAYRINSIQGTPMMRNAAKKITPKIAPNRQ